MFRTEINNFYNCFGDHKSMVLSTERNSIIHSRMMSVICFDGKFYFQTDKKFRKCKDIEFNSNVALCTDNVQIEGIARQIGSPKDNIEFCRCFEKAFPKAFEKYTMLENEILYEIVPKNIYRWIYNDDKQYIEHFDIENQSYSKTEYIGE